MPARTETTAANSTAVAPAPAKRFELPALEFNFASLTDGTDIPPPAPSPIEEEVVAPPPKTPAEQKDKPSKLNGNHSSTSPQSNTTTTTVGGTKRPADDNPVSPTFSTRQGSIRRLFSKNLLSSAYADGEESVDGDARRPVSRTSTGFGDAKKAKRSSGWFSRLRSNENASNKRASIAVAPEEKKPTGPPPPMIPELSELKSSLNAQDDSGLGSDLFKDIK